MANGKKNPKTRIQHSCRITPQIESLVVFAIPDIPCYLANTQINKLWQNITSSAEVKIDVHSSRNVSRWLFCAVSFARLWHQIIATSCCSLRWCGFLECKQQKNAAAGAETEMTSRKLICNFVASTTAALRGMWYPGHRSNFRPSSFVGFHGKRLIYRSRNVRTVNP